MVEIGADDEATACCPEYFCIVVVLALVFLEGVEDAATAEQIAPFIDIASCCACVFERLTFFPIPDLRLAGCEVWGGLHCVMERGEPAGGDLKIGREEYV